MSLTGQLSSQLSRPPPNSAEALEFLHGPHHLFINGEWREATGTRDIIVENPARAMPIATIRAASLADLDDAVAAARDSFKQGWGKLLGAERARIMHRFADLLDENADVFAEIVTLDSGSPLPVSRFVVKQLAAEMFRYNAGWATKISGDTFEPSIGDGLNDFLVAAVKEPVGVVGAIVPWNAPPGMIALKLAPALAAGCTMVLKTAELAPLSGAFFAKLLHEAGAPPGTFNLLHGHGEDVGAAMAAHPGIDKIAFTGSTAVGRQIVAAATGNLKKVSLELGGKSPVIVFPDADLDRVIPGAAMAYLVNSGQACMAGTRLFLHEDIHDEVVQNLAAYVCGLRLGDGMMPGTDLGPLISARQKTRVLEYIALGRSEGARMITGAAHVPPVGHFVAPVIFTECRADMRIVREEIFGPVLTVLRFKDEAGLMRDVQDTVYGLSGSVWTRDIQRALRIAKQIDSGQVGVNYHAAVSPETPFGGNRQSGWGREFGREGVEAYLKTKAISINLGDRA
jgi:phenylacetaldehyde dehydrogenase